MKKSIRHEFLIWFNMEMMKGTIPATHKESAWAAWLKSRQYKGSIK